MSSASIEIGLDSRATPGSTLTLRLDEKGDVHLVIAARFDEKMAVKKGTPVVLEESVGLYELEQAVRLLQAARTLSDR